MFSKLPRNVNQLYQRALATSTKRQAQDPKFLITGGRGQLGRGMADELSSRYGASNILLTDVSTPTDEDNAKNYNHMLNVCDEKHFEEYVQEFEPTWILHLPALLSASCEANLSLARAVNYNSVFTAFDLARKYKTKLFIPSSIGAFGPNSPLEDVPDKCIQDPTTYYGVGKVFVENHGYYERNQHNLDFRCLRYPGIISPVAEPGGGTTDYAVDIFHKIVGENATEFSSFLGPNARLPMMLESDCIKGTCDYLAVDNEVLKKIPNNTAVYNLAGCDFTPQEIADEIKKQFKDFDMKYDVDPARQAIAENWPKVFRADGAKNDWGWEADVNSTEKLVAFMIENTPRK